MPDPDRRDWIPGLVACLAVGLMVGGLLVGYEPVGGDPDRIFRPIKAELAEALGEWRLPTWSARLGLGVPLVAESHVAAFYPANWGLYRFLGVPAAYRLSMWLHTVGIAAATFAYARQLGIGARGAAVSALAFPFCGFLTVHSSHEWAYHNLAFLPLCLLAADRYAGSGRASWLAGLALLWGAQITLGHFQVQMWTGGLALVLGTWRILAERLPLRRIAGLALGLAWGGAVAAAQLVPTWELARLVGQTRRSFAELAYYSYPPGHWAELAVPGLFRRLAGGGEAPYWFTQQTTGFEACLFIGTIPLLLAAIGMIGGGRRLAPWRWAVPLSFALATMPRWWPQGYAMVLQVPGLGYFRCPGRYTAITSFALAILAGRGLDPDIPPARFRVGLGLAGVFVVAAFAWAFGWTSAHPDLRKMTGGDVGLAMRLGLAAATWAVAFWIVAGWRRARPWGVMIVTAAELAGFYYAGGTTRWGWSVLVPASSPALAALAKEPGPVRVGGGLDNLPVRAALATATPYTGFPLLPPHPLLKAVQDPRMADDPASPRWLRRYGVTHLVREGPISARAGPVLYQGGDPALDVLAYRPPGSPEHGGWRVVRIDGTFPEARVALRAVVAPSRDALVESLSRRDARDEAWYLPGDEPPATTSGARATSARVLRWDGLAGEVEHDGTCDLVLARASYPGWVVRVDDGPEVPVGQADGGLIAVRLPGSGVSRVAIRYSPNGLGAAIAVSVAAGLGAIGVIAQGAFSLARSRSSSG